MAAASGACEDVSDAGRLSTRLMFCSGHISRWGCAGEVASPGTPAGDGRLALPDLVLLTLDGRLVVLVGLDPTLAASAEESASCSTGVSAYTPRCPRGREMRGWFLRREDSSLVVLGTSAGVGWVLGASKRAPVTGVCSDDWPAADFLPLLLGVTRVPRLVRRGTVTSSGAGSEFSELFSELCVGDDSISAITAPSDARDAREAFLTETGVEVVALATGPLAVARVFRRDPVDGGEAVVASVG